VASSKADLVEELAEADQTLDAVADILSDEGLSAEEKLEAIEAEVLEDEADDE